VATIVINGKTIPILATGADWAARQIYGWELNGQKYGHNLTDWFQTDLGPCPVQFTLRYADFVGQTHEPLTADEYHSQTQVDIRSYLIFQKRTDDPAGGRPRGEAFGREAVAYARQIGYTGSFIAFTADAPVGSYNIDVAMEFFKGAQAIVNAAGFKCCVYGFWDIVYAAQDRGIGDLYWLCGALSRWRSGIHLYQWNNGRIYPGRPAVDADLCIQFESLPNEQHKRKDEDVTHYIKGDGGGPDIKAVTSNADGYWGRVIAEGEWLLLRACALAEDGVELEATMVHQVDYDNVPTRSGAAQQVWNYGVPTTPGENPPLYEAAHQVLAQVLVKQGVTLTPEQLEVLATDVIDGLSGVVPTAQENAAATVEEFKKEGN